jgi:signal transduction histidine kinase
MKLDHHSVQAPSEQIKEPCRDMPQVSNQVPPGNTVIPNYDIKRLPDRATDTGLPQRISGRWLVFARIAWGVAAVLAVVLFGASLSIYHNQLQTACTNGACAVDQLTPESMRTLERLGYSVSFYAAYLIALKVAFVVVWCLIAGVIVWRAPEDQIALFVALMLVTFSVAIPGVLPALTTAYPGWRLPVYSVGYLGFGSAILFFYTFPDGRFLPHWTCWLAVAWLVLVGHGIFVPNSPFFGNTWLSPIVFVAFAGASIVIQIYRYRRVSNPMQRQQTKWVIFGVTAALAGCIGMAVTEAILPLSLRQHPLVALAQSTAVYGILLLIPLSLGIAILRYRLWDIDPIINRTLVYGTLTASIIGIYVLVVGYLGALFRTSDNLLVSLIATAIVAVLFQPLREWFQRGVNRLMYGERDDPYAVISRLGQRLEATLAPNAVLPTIVGTVKEALKLPYAAIALKQNEASMVVAESGVQMFDPVTLPLTYQGEPIGHLILSPRANGETFSPNDYRLLDDLARQAGVAAHAVRLHADTLRLAEDLQHSRERLVTAREEERRRLRRDLHDGLGPRLASQTMKLEAARDLLTVDLARADTLLNDLIQQSQSVIADIRRLVYGLRPPALDELGLLSAIREQAAQYAHIGLHITIDAPEQLPPLSAAVEVAAYRIAQEALTNVVRHANAHHCTIRLAFENAMLSVEIVDDGIGLPEERRAGVGMHSIRERAEELGGTCVIEASSTGGTRVLAHLPLP